MIYLYVSMMYECAKSQSNIPKNSLKHGTKVEIPCTLAPGGGGHTNIFLTGMLVREQISTIQKNRMTPNSNPRKIECPKFKPKKNRMTQDAMFVKV